MKIRNTTILRSAMGAASALAMLAYAGAAQAAGVNAGTLITSTASATYSTGTTNGSVQSNTVSVRVDEVLDVTVNGLNAAPVAANEDATFAWSITNTGNGSESFKIDVVQLNTDDFDLVIKQIAIDSNGNGVYDAGIDQIIPDGGFTPAIAADTSLKVFVVASVPAGATPGQTGQINLSAMPATQTAGGNPGDVIAGAGDGGTNAVIGSNIGNNTGNTETSTLTVTSDTNTADIALTKSATVLNQFMTSQPVPGATITYTITATVTKGTAKNVVVNDIVPTGTTFVPGSIKLGGAALTDGADMDAGQFSGNAIAVKLGDVASTDGAKTVTFQVKIN